MDRTSFNFSSSKWFVGCFIIWVTWCLIPYSQAQPPEPQDTTPAVQEGTNTAEDQGEVVERGILRRDHRGLPGLPPPKSTTPSSPAPRVFTPPASELSPQGTLSINAGTPSLTAVANAIQLKHKSLTTLIVLPPNLPVTQPVEISIGYFSPAGSYAPGFQRITQAYVRGTGNHFLNNDPAGDGKRRQMRVDITLRELQSGGQSFSVSWPINLEPLYDLEMSPLTFNLLSRCDTFGKSDIVFEWNSPDKKKHSIPKFGLSGLGGSTKIITEFAWSASETSNLGFVEPTMRFYDSDPGTDHFLPVQRYVPPPPAPGTRALLPGSTQTLPFDFILRDDSGQSCKARIKYTIKRTLRFYPIL